MLWVFLILALAIIVFIAIFVIALVVTRKVGLVDDGTFAQYSHIATIVGLPLAVIGAIGESSTILHWLGWRGKRIGLKRIE